MIYLGRKFSYREMDELSNRLANFLIESGLKPDDVVGPGSERVGKVLKREIKRLTTKA